jgi:putative intracellular protease/amidase
MKKVGIVFFDQFTDIDVVMHWDLLNRVRQYCGLADFEVKLLGTASAHVSMSGLCIPATGSLAEIKDADAVLFASGRGTRSLIQNSAYLQQLKSYLDPQRQLIAAQCSGSLLLGAIGLLRHVNVSAYPPILELLLSYGAQPVQKSFVVDRQFATASGCLAAPQLSGWLIQQLVSEQAATQVLESAAPLEDLLRPVASHAV